MSDDVDCADEALEYDYDVEFDLKESPETLTVENDLFVPFLHNFKHPLGLRSNLTIEGTVLDNADKFAVDLCHKKDNNRKDVIFHFSVRLDLNYVARNTFNKGSWGHEESAALRKIPFQSGQNFIIEIFLLIEHFLVSVNGNHFCNYRHRLSPLFIDSLEIYGRVKLSRVQLTKSDVYPSILLSDEFYFYKSNFKKDVTPFYYQIHELQYDSLIIIEGRVKLLPHRIAFNLQSGPQVYPNPLVGFHLSARWDTQKENTIVFNTWDESWNQEIVSPMDLVFVPGDRFKMSITVNKNVFQVQINSTQLPEYPIRITKSSRPFLDVIETLFVYGDVEISNVNFLERHS